VESRSRGGTIRQPGDAYLSERRIDQPFQIEEIEGVARGEAVQGVALTSKHDTEGLDFGRQFVATGREIDASQLEEPNAPLMPEIGGRGFEQSWY